jgi:hypothetical protein
MRRFGKSLLRSESRFMTSPWRGSILSCAGEGIHLLGEGWQESVTRPDGLRQTYRRHREVFGLLDLARILVLFRGVDSVLATSVMIDVQRGVN